MKKTICFWFLFICFSITSLAQADETLVRKSFDGYKSAILNDKGDEAVAFVDSRTLSYYGEILEKSKLADSATVSAMGVLDKLMVLSIRHRTSTNDLLSFDGTDLLKYAIKEGMVGKNSVANNTVGDITIVDDFAKGQLLVSGQATEMFFHFYKEEGVWKMDLTALFPAGQMAFEQMIEQSGTEENEFMMMALEMISGKPTDTSIWHPIKQ